MYRASTFIYLPGEKFLTPSRTQHSVNLWKPFGGIHLFIRKLWNNLFYYRRDLFHNYYIFLFNVLLAVTLHKNLKILYAIHTHIRVYICIARWNISSGNSMNFHKMKKFIRSKFSTSISFSEFFFISITVNLDCLFSFFSYFFKFGKITVHDFNNSSTFLTTFNFLRSNLESFFFRFVEKWIFNRLTFFIFVSQLLFQFWQKITVHDFNDSSLVFAPFHFFGSKFASFLL